MNSELLPCPFCGNTNIMVHEEEGKYGFTEWVVYCDSHYCACQPTAHDSYQTKEEAIEAWNTRAERTCKMELVKRGPIYTVWRFSCCGYEHSENNTDSGATGIPETVCPKCGTKVEKK